MSLIAVCGASSILARAAGRHDIPATALVMNILPREPNTESNDDRAERLRRYKAGRVIEFLSTCIEFEDLQENNFLEMNFTDLTEFYVMQLGYESLEECYERFVYREPMPAIGPGQHFQTTSLQCFPW